MTADEQQQHSCLSGEKDAEKKGRRRPGRRARQFPEPLDACGPGEGEAQDKIATCAVDDFSTSPLRSPSPSCMPNPSFKSRSSGIMAAPAIRAPSRLESCSSEAESFPGSLGQKQEAFGPKCGNTCGEGGDSTPRAGSGGRVEYVPITASKLKSKVSSPLPIPKPTWKEASRSLKSGSDSSPCGKNSFPMSDYKPRQIQKVVNRSENLGSPQATTSGESCNCSENALIYAGSLTEETTTNASHCRNRVPVEDVVGSSQCWPGSKFHGSPSGSSLDGCFIDKLQLDQRIRSSPDFLQRSCYPAYWPMERISQALEAGEVFQAKIRVNSHNRSEAYLSLEGLPMDILIDGLRAQNRAIDGDLVAFVLNPVSTWPKLKASSSKQNNNYLCVKATDRLLNNNNLLRTELHGSSSDEGQFDTTQCGREVASTGSASIGFEFLSTNHMSSEMTFPKTSFLDPSLCSENVLNTETERAIRLKDANDERRGFQEGLERHNLDGIFKGAGEVGGLLKPQRSTPVISNHSPKTLTDLAAIVSTLPDRRPTGQIVAILEKSPRREGLIGFLEVHLRLANGYGARGSRNTREESPNKASWGLTSQNSSGIVMFVPSDNKFPKMSVFVNALPDDLRKKYYEGDATLRNELVAARVDEWRPDCFAPKAVVSHSLGQGGELEAQTTAILYEHAIHSAEFPPVALACLPKVPWKIPNKEYENRRDLRRLRIFSIDPPSARDLDDALSIERLDNGMIRIGVHIADVSFFVRPDTALDKEAQDRSTSVYLIQRVLPMLPRLLCEELCSLNPGVDRLAFSIIWDMNSSGEITDHWIGRTIICTCCKLSYSHAQEMITSTFGAESIGLEECIGGAGLPELYGDFCWKEVVDDVKSLHEIAKKRRESRFEAGALRLENSKLVFALDEEGIPCDSMLYEHRDSNFLVEEFMLLANMTVAKVISNAFPDCALLRRHPEPNMRKLKDLEDFCSKIGLELDVSSSGSLHESLTKLRDDLKDDPALCSILMLYATKPMQLAKYFCTGELRDKEGDWGHYALATSFYTHFTSPIRRYPDIVVHRTIAAALEAEEKFSSLCSQSTKESKSTESSVSSGKGFKSRCFTGPNFDKEAAASPAGLKALAMAASKHKLPGCVELGMVAEHCNERKLASRNVRDASDKLYLWAMLKKKQGIPSDARVLAVGPKFLSLYVSKIAMERRIYYDEIEGLRSEWFEATGTLVLDLAPQKLKKQRQGKQRTVADVAFLVNPADSSNIGLESETFEDVIREVQERLQGKLHMNEETMLDIEDDLNNDKSVEPAVLPLTLRLLSSLPVYVYAVGGENGPVDVAVRLYLSSYLT